MIKTERNPTKDMFLELYKYVNLLEVVFCLDANQQLPAPSLIFVDDPHSDAIYKQFTL